MSPVHVVVADPVMRRRCRLSAETVTELRRVMGPGSLPVLLQRLHELCALRSLYGGALSPELDALWRTCMAGLE